MRAIILGLIAAMAASMPAGAEETPAPAKDRLKKICKSDKATGTRVSRQRTCRTAEEWEFLRKQATEEARELQDNTQNRYGSD